MSAFFELAYAAASSRLCIFTGTGFSKAITNDKAPSWRQLLEIACEKLPDSAALKEALFPDEGKMQLSLEEAAQVIAIKLSHHGKNLHEEIAKIIEDLELKGNNSIIAQFLKENPISVITTNYDKLTEKLMEGENYHSITPGLPIPRSRIDTKIYHIHGSIDSPRNMVVTADDYFKFINSESYFSRKLSTILHENTIAIIGYSLGDTNLKAILSEYRGFSKNHVIGGNIFFISRGEVDVHLKDYYWHCYGIRVLDNLTVHDFFSQTNDSLEAARKIALESVASIKKVLYEKKKYADDFLRSESSFFVIVSAVAAIGKSINDPLIVDILKKTIEKKIALTGKSGAWEQYEHLAKWLIYLGTVLELEGTTMKDTYLSAVLKSMTRMSKRHLLGYSWQAYVSWKNDWSNLISSNRTLIRNHIKGNTTDIDALAVVEIE